MSEWIEKPLGQVANIAIGGTPARDNPKYWDPTGREGYPWVSIADLGPKFITDTKEKITVDGVRFSNVKLVIRDTLLLSFKLTIGRAGIAGQDLFTNEAIAAITPVPGTVLTKFIYYTLPSVAKHSVTDTAIKGITLNKQKLASLVVRFPKKIGIQKSIVKILEAVDIAIEQTESLIAKYEQIKAGLMHDLFTRGINADGKLRLPREQAPELYKETPTGWIPTEWTPSSLSSLVGRSNIINGPFGSDLLTSELKSEGVPVLYVQDIKPGYFNRISNANVTQYKAMGLAFCNVRAGDVLVAKVGAPPCDSCVYDLGVDAIVTQDVIRIRPVFNIDSVYLSSLINSTFGRKSIKKIAIQGTRERVSLTEFKALVFPIAAPQEQVDIGKLLAGVQALIEKETNKRAKLLRLKPGLMHDLLTGKVSVGAERELMEEACA